MKTSDARHKCGAELKKISALVEAADRKKAMEEFGVSYVTISRYLRGHVANLILGIRLLQLFKKLVRRRSASLGKLVKGS
jgi:hypothetical protein